MWVHESTTEHQKAYDFVKHSMAAQLESQTHSSYAAIAAHCPKRSCKAELALRADPDAPAADDMPTSYTGFLSTLTLAPPLEPRRARSGPEGAAPPAISSSAKTKRKKGKTGKGSSKSSKTRVRHK